MADAVSYTHLDVYKRQVHFHPNNPFWEDFKYLNQYVTRVQSCLQDVTPDNDVLLYLSLIHIFESVPCWWRIG